jgi:hypothetical protein
VLNLDEVDKWVSIAFKVTVVLYVLVIAAQRIFRPDVYELISVPLGAIVGLLLAYIGASWTLKKLGYVKNGSITVSRKALVTTLGTVAAGIFFAIFVEVFIHNLYLTRQATLDLQVSTAGRDALGDPIRVGWYIDGYQRSDVAAFSIPVKGSKAAGKLKMKGIRKDDLWHISELYLIVDGNGGVVQIPH